MARFVRRERSDRRCVMKWTGMPEPTQEQIEQEVISLILGVMDFKKRNDRPKAKWNVGTTNNLEECLEKFSDLHVFTAMSTWCFGSAYRAAQEIAEYHEMEIERTISEYDSAIYVYTDRPPTMDERKQRSKDPLTLKQKLAFREIKNFVDRNNRGPTKTELSKILQHRSSQTTMDLLDILERKNWTIIREGQRHIELI